MKSFVLRNLAVFYNKRKILIWISALLVISTVLAVGCLLLPDLFWDNFLYKYFWGPVVADKEGRPIDGISEGYNALSTVIYGVLLALAVLAMYKVARRFRVEIDFLFIASCLPLFLFGGVARALEDAGLFDGWVQYFFISPVIYLLVGLIFFSAAATGLIIRRWGGDWSVLRRTVVFALLVLVLEALYLIITFSEHSSLSYVLPAPVAIVFGAVAIILFHLLISKGMSLAPASIFSVGILVLLVSASYVVAFLADPGWQQPLEQSGVGLAAPHMEELVIIPLIALALTAALWAVGRFGARTSLVSLSVPVNLVLFFSHFLDGAATYRGIDLYGYGEKHVLPTFLIDAFGTAAIMLLLKLLLVLAIVALVDILFREELKPYRNLPNIMKFAVIFLGLAPG
ncbi:MAG: DUF63 family protein, partial [Euryarchaeota archaeon]|nr:DUF63 family protein [Euryarchaeota archaeon]